MEDIYIILKKFGLEIPADKKEDFEKMVSENYKTVSEVDTLQTKFNNMEQANNELMEKYETDIGTRDSDLKELQKKLKDAGADTEKIQTLEGELETLRSTYETDRKTYEEKLSKQAHEFLVREAAGNIKFTSSSAKKAFISDALAEETIHNKDGKLTGFDDFVKAYKETDADAFAEEQAEGGAEQETPKSFSGKSSNPNSPEPEAWTQPLIL